MDVKIYNQLGQETGTIELPKVFESRWNADLVHQVVTAQAANRRPSVAHVKSRGEVRGGGRKPWRQKGTGRARHGSIRSPIWKGGGVTHGPTKDRSFEQKINRKMAQRALATVIAAKARDGELLVLDHLTIDPPKTREAAKIFRALARVGGFADLAGRTRRALVLLPDAAPGLRRALRNLPALELAEARNITALDAIRRRCLVLPAPSLTVLAARFPRGG